MSSMPTLNYKSYTEYINVFRRLNPTPIDYYSVFENLADAETYINADDSVAYEGQIIAIYDNEIDEYRGFIVCYDRTANKKYLAQIAPKETKVNLGSWFLTNYNDDELIFTFDTTPSLTITNNEIEIEILNGGSINVVNEGNGFIFKQELLGDNLISAVSYISKIGNTTFKIICDTEYIYNARDPLSNRFLANGNLKGIAKFSDLDGDYLHDLDIDDVTLQTLDPMHL